MPKKRNERDTSSILNIGVTIVADSAAEPSAAYIALWRRLLGPVPEQACDTTACSRVSTAGASSLPKAEEAQHDSP